jgi:hypothetical protein
VTDESICRYAHYTTEKLEQLERQVEQQNGDALPGLLADVRAELARRREEAGRSDGSG